MESMGIDPDFWKGRRIFITGHTGIKGGWLTLFLHLLGAEVHGYALKPPSEPNFFSLADVGRYLVTDSRSDLNDSEALKSALTAAKPDIVIHMAAQALVRDSYLDPVATYSTNVMGTVNVLEAVRNNDSVQAVLNITSDKCYENKEWLWGYRENDPMGGYDPYSSSKGCAELVTSAYYRSFLKDNSVGTATARAGNVIGGGDWATDRLIPDAVRAFVSGKALEIRNPDAVRPWQHVLDPLAGYLLLCQQLVTNRTKFSGAWNFGPGKESARPVSSIADNIVELWGSSASWQLSRDAHPHEAVMLQLDCSKAAHLLHWKPVWSLERAVKETMSWYRAWQDGGGMDRFSISQLESYLSEHLLS